VAELKALKSGARFSLELEHEKENDKGKKIIDVEPNTIVSTTKTQKIELEDPKEWKRFFHS